MSIEIRSKLNLLLRQWPDGRILSSRWLKTKGYGPELIQKYKKSGWIEALGSGVYKKPSDAVDWSSVVDTLQNQLELRIHVGGKSALELHGKAQYMKFAGSEITLLGNRKEALPLWAKKTKWDTTLKYQMKTLFREEPTTFARKEAGFTRFKTEKGSVIIAAPERAYLEYLDDIPQRSSYQEALDLLENLISLRSGILQSLLQICSSLKVKRLFLHLAEKINHPWISKLDLSKIELGSGKRVIFKNGALDPRYNITIPKEPNDESF